MTRTEQSMYDALEYCNLATLPEIADGKSVWCNAIAKTKKVDGNHYYCYVEIDLDGKPRIIKDFGTCVAIVRFEEFYPIHYLEPTYIRKFAKNDEANEKMIEYLMEHGIHDAMHASTRKELDKMNIRVAIKKQLADEKKKKETIIKD